MRRHEGVGSRVGGVVGVVGLVLTGPAAGQVAQRAAFVTNNGNLEGSVTSYVFTAEGAPVFVQKFVTGSGSGHPGTNAYAIALTPNGRYLAVTHATSATVSERLTLLRVNADATLTPAGTFSTPDSPLAATWITNQFLAVTLTNLSIPNRVIMYRFEESAGTLAEIARYDTGTFTAHLVAHPDGWTLYAADSGASPRVSVFYLQPDGTLQAGPVVFTGPRYPLGPGITRDGNRFYAGGGISDGGNKILGFQVGWATMTLIPLPGSPYVSPGSSPSPKQCVSSRDGRFLFVAHGSSSEVRSFAIDPDTGDLADTGFAYDFGIQGDLGGIAVLGDLLLGTRRYTTGGATGLLAFTIHANGSFTLNGGPVSSQGSVPQFIAAWEPSPVCYPNCDGSTTPPVLNVADFTCFLQRFAAGDPYANCDGSTTPPVLNVADFTCFLQRFAAGCSAP